MIEDETKSEFTERLRTPIATGVGIVATVATLIGFGIAIAPRAYEAADAVTPEGPTVEEIEQERNDIGPACSDSEELPLDGCIVVLSSGDFVSVGSGDVRLAATKIASERSVSATALLRPPEEEVELEFNGLGEREFVGEKCSTAVTLSDVDTPFFSKNTAVFLIEPNDEGCNPRAESE